MVVKIRVFREIWGRRNVPVVVERRDLHNDTDNLCLCQCVFSRVR